MIKITSLLLLCLTLLASVNLDAQTPLWEVKPNYDTQSDPFFEGIDGVPPEELGTWGVVESVHTLNGLEPSLSIQLPSGPTLTFNRDYSDVDTFNVITWFGINNDVFNYPNSVAHFTIHQDSLLGYVTLNDSCAYEILPIRNDYYVCYDTKYDKSCENNLIPNYLDTNLRMSRLRAPRLPYYCSGLDIYRMIIAYTPQFANTFPVTNRQQHINKYLKGVVDSTNQTYINGNTSIRVRLALSYQTDNEFGSKNSDSPAFAKKAYRFLWSSRSDKYDEIFDLRKQYRADVAILLVSYNDGGRAHRRSQTAIYGKVGAGTNYGVAHEVGHMFDLEHNRGEFGWFKKRLLDRKKAYGHRGVNYKTVMSRGSQTRVGFNSDPSFQYPDLQSAGSSKAKARNYMRDHMSNVILYNDPIDLTLSGRTIYYNQMTSQFGYNYIKMNNYTIQGGAVTNYRAGNYIELNPGTVVNHGATANFEIKPCGNTQVFRVGKESENDDGSVEIEEGQSELSVYPNPTNGDLTIQMKFDAEKKYQLFLYDSMGRVLIEQFGQGTTIDEKLNLQDFDQNLFILKVIAGGEVFTQKVLKTN